jgi:uncharacterized membrane-anchored protein
VDIGAISSPGDVTLGDQATLHLPSDTFYVPRKESAELMRTWGNTVDDHFLGLVMSNAKDQNWVITIDHTAEGYVKDDDAKSWDAAELLQSLKDGTEAGNEQRIAQGLPALDVVDWVQSPQYDAAKHQLAWSLKAVNRGAPSSDPATINFNTYALGRDGYFQINLLTDDRSVEKDKPFAFTVVSAVDYNPGKRYSDFVAGTDHVAEYGLAALVAGIAAKKLGILALGGLFLAKFAKLIVVGLAVAGAAVTKLFRRKKDDASA